LRKTFVLDTNVLLFDPRSIFQFEDNIVFLPIIVVEELDRFKKDQNENGRNARYFSRVVDELRQQGSLAEGVELEGGGKLVISIGEDYNSSVTGIDLKINDNKILANALALKDKGETVILISKDINLRLKADALGLPSQDYISRQASSEEVFSGQKIFEVTAERLAKFESERFLDMTQEEMENSFPNEYMIICEEGNLSHRRLGRYSAQKKGLVPLIRVREGVFGIYPKNVEQQFAFDALLNHEVNLVSLIGKAGTGKTLLAIAAGLEQTVSQRLYNRVLVSRPVMPMGRDLGFLPGDVNEKLGPWMQPIFDNIDFLFGTKSSPSEVSWDELITKGLLHVEPLTYIRGRSLPEQYMIVDEAQNLSPHEIKTIITRAGEGTKIILTGDTEQIDNPYLDSLNNGLSYCVDRLKTEEIVAHILLKVGERSPLSELASSLM